MREDQRTDIRGFDGKVHWKAEDFKSCIQFDYAKDSTAFSISVWGDTEEEVKSLFDHAYEKLENLQKK